jgi:hypothetical protein
MEDCYSIWKGGGETGGSIDMVLSLSVRWQEAMAKGIFEKKKTCLLFRHSNMRELIIFRFSSWILLW